MNLGFASNIFRRLFSLKAVFHQAEFSARSEISLCLEQLGNLLSLCREIAGARDILQKFENLKKQHE
jgi:hypothetical protein